MRKMIVLCSLLLAMCAVVRGLSVKSDFVLVKGGTFMMGSPESEDWRGKDEKQHKVTVSSFYMAKYEVTQKVY